MCQAQLEKTETHEHICISLIQSLSFIYSKENEIQEAESLVHGHPASKWQSRVRAQAAGSGVLLLASSMFLLRLRVGRRE